MKIQTICYDFFIIRTISQSDRINIYIAKDLKNEGSEEQYVINEVIDHDIIKAYIAEFTKYKNSNNDKSVFFDFFTHNSNMYIVFKYTKESPLSDYLKNTMLHYTERITLLKQILFELSSFQSMPPVVLNSIIELDNINIDRNNNIYFNFFINSSLLYSNPDNSNIFKEISLLIHYLFNDEMSSRNHKLQIIAEKSRKGIYNSIPELIKDIEHLGADQDAISKIKAWIHEKRGIISKLNLIAIILLMLFGAYYLYDTYIKSKNLEASSYKVNVDKIGDISYAKPPEPIKTEEQKEYPDIIYIAPEKQPLPAEAPKTFESEINSNSKADPQTSKAEDQNQAFEDYTVKPGDNLMHICKRYYGSRDYWKAVSQYNNLKNNSFLRTGQIIKLPSKEYLDQLPR